MKRKEFIIFIIFGFSIYLCLAMLGLVVNKFKDDIRGQTQMKQMYEVKQSGYGEEKQTEKNSA